MNTIVAGYRKGILFVAFGALLFAGLWVTLRTAGPLNLLAAAALFGSYAGALGVAFGTLMNAYGKSYAANAEIAVGQIAAMPPPAQPDPYRPPPPPGPPA
jgi:FtsH-binding integral membrane protein